MRMSHWSAAYHSNSMYMYQFCYLQVSCGKESGKCSNAYLRCKNQVVFDVGFIVWIFPFDYGNFHLGLLVVKSSTLGVRFHLFVRKTLYHTYNLCLQHLNFISNIFVMNKLPTSDMVT